MARLPGIEDLGPRPTPQPGGGIVSVRPAQEPEALARTGAAMSDSGKMLEQEQERMDTLRAEDAFTKLREHQQDLEFNPETGFRKLKGGDVVGKPIREDYEKRLTDKVTELETGLNDGRQRELFRRRAAISRVEMRSDIFRHTERETDVYAKQVLGGSLDAEMRNIGQNFDNPMKFGMSVERINNLIDGEGDRLKLPQQMREQEKNKYLEAAWTNRLNAWRMSDPAGALMALHQNTDEIGPALTQKFGESLFRDAAPVLAAQMLQSGELRTVAANDTEAQAIARLGDAMGKQVSVTVDPKFKGDTAFDMLPGDQKLRLLDYARTQAQQGMAQVRESLGFRVQDATEALERGLSVGDMPTPQELTQAYGAERGTRIAGSLDAARRFGSDVSRVATMSPAEQQDLLTTRKPQPGAGFAVEVGRHEELVRAVTQVNTARAKDPAAYTLQYAPAVSAAFKAMNDAPNDPQAVAAYAQATVAEQKRLGIAEPVLLPKPMADAIARQFNDLSEGAQKPAQLIQQYGETWGRHWPQVYRQIAKEIGPSARVIANLRDTPAAAMLSMNAGMKTKDLRSPIPAGDAKTVDDAVEIELASFRQSLAGWTTGGSGTYNDFDEAAKRNAYVYTAQGVKPGEAAKRAARELVGDYYSFIGPTRVPTNVSLPAVEAGLSATLRDADKLSARVPDNEARILGPEFAAKQIGTSLKNNGFFVTLGDDSGVALYMKGNNGERAVEGADGKPITFTWKQLIERGTASAARASLRTEQNDGGAATGRARQRGYGPRADGTEKGSGYFGELKATDGNVMTEYSIGVDLEGKQREIPTIVPTLTKAELDQVLSLRPTDQIPKPIIDKAVEHARKRIADGKDPFAQPGEQTRRPR